MRKLVIAYIIILVIFLSGCAYPTPHHEKIDGVNCIVQRDRFHRVKALSCKE